MTEQQSVTAQRGRVTWPPIRNALVQVLELSATNEGKEWSADHLIAIIDRQRKSLKSLRDRNSTNHNRLCQALRVQDKSDWPDLIALAENIVGAQANAEKDTQEHLHRFAEVLGCRPSWESVTVVVSDTVRRRDELLAEGRNQALRINHFTGTVRRIGEALEMPQGLIASDSIVTEAAQVRHALNAQRLENEKLHAQLAAKDGPPTLSSLVALHESNYQDIAYALGIPGSESGKTFTVRDLIDHIHHYVEGTNEAYSQMTRRAEEAEARLAEESQGWEERVASRTELVERVKTLEAELAYARDTLALNQIHEGVGEEIKQGHELAAARNLVRALEAEKLVRDLTEDLEVAQAEASLFSRVGGQQADENASRVLHRYDQLTLGLSYLWGDDRKEEFLRLLEGDPQFMDRLEAKYKKRLKKARKAENR